jgi:hypothetical protein
MNSTHRCKAQKISKRHRVSGILWACVAIDVDTPSFKLGQPSLRRGVPPAYTCKCLIRFVRLYDRAGATQRPCTRSAEQKL